MLKTVKGQFSLPLLLPFWVPAQGKDRVSMALLVSSLTCWSYNPLPRRLVLSLCALNLLLVISKLLNTSGRGPGRFFASWVFFLPFHCSRLTSFLFPVLVPCLHCSVAVIGVCQLLSTSQPGEQRSFLFGERRCLVVRLEFMASVAKHGWELTSENKPDVQKMAQGTGLLDKLPSVAPELETDVWLSCSAAYFRWSRVEGYGMQSHCQQCFLARGFTKQAKFVLSHTSGLELLSCCYYLLCSAVSVIKKAVEGNCTPKRLHHDKSDFCVDIC